MLGQKTSWRTLQACCVVIIGFLIGSEGEVNFSWIGVFFGILSSIFIALHGIFVKKGLLVVNNNEWYWTCGAI
jgi:GDP-fucose transporter C1